VKCNALASPTPELVRINSVLALKTMLMGCPWDVREFEGAPHYLAPNERKYFKKLAETWGATIERQIEQRLLKKEAA
jgi:hypothetical protein